MKGPISKVTNIAKKPSLKSPSDVAAYYVSMNPDALQILYLELIRTGVLRRVSIFETIIVISPKFFKLTMRKD